MITFISNLKQQRTTNEISPLGDRIVKELDLHNNPIRHELVLNIADAEVQLNLIGAALMANFSSTLFNAPEILLDCVRCIAKHPDLDHSKCKSCHNLCLSVLIHATDDASRNEEGTVTRVCKNAVNQYTQCWAYIRDNNTLASSSLLCLTAVQNSIMKHCKFCWLWIPTS